MSNSCVNSISNNCIVTYFRWFTHQINNYPFFHLLPGLQQQKRVHCYSGSSVIYSQWFLANGVGTKSEWHRHGNQLHWKRAGESICNIHDCTMQFPHQLSLIYIAHTVVKGIKMPIKPEQEQECQAIYYIMFSFSRLSVKNTGLHSVSHACMESCWSPQHRSRRSPTGLWENSQWHM